MGRLIADADICIDMLRNYGPAVKCFETHEVDIALSVVTIAELLAGFRKENEEKRILHFISFLKKFPVTEDVALKAGYLRHRYGKSHGTGIIDCIVAATALIENLTVVTLNRKHYPMLKNNILIPYKKS